MKVNLWEVKMGDIVPRNKLVKQGVKGLGGVGGGITILILSSLGTISGLVFGGLLTAVGILISKSKDDRIAGTIVAGAGIITLISLLIKIPAIGSVASWLMGIGGVGLILAGGWSIFKFIKNLRKRS